jgi:hypothetical protein
MAAREQHGSVTAMPARLTHPHRVREAKRKLRHRLKVAAAEARRLAEAEKRRTQGV